MEAAETFMSKGFGSKGIRPQALGSRLWGAKVRWVLSGLRRLEHLEVQFVLYKEPPLQVQEIDFKKKQMNVSDIPSFF